MVVCETSALEAEFDVVLVDTDEFTLLETIFELIVP